MKDSLPHSWMLNVLADLKAYSTKQELTVCEEALKEAHQQVMIALLVERNSERPQDVERLDSSNEMRKVLTFMTTYKGQLF